MEEKIGIENKEIGNTSEEIIKDNGQSTTIDSDKNGDFEIKDGKYRFKKGNQAFRKRKPKKPFSLREDLIKSLRRIKKQNPLKYKEIIDSYWSDKRMRQFLLEIVDGKARQSTEVIGSLENPVRIIEVRPMEKEGSQDLSRADK